MTTVEKELIMALCLGKISKELFFQKYPINISINKNYFIDSLNETLTTKNKEDVEYILLIAGHVNSINEYYPVIRKLILENWHNQHEHLVDMLSGSGNPDDAKYFYCVLQSNYYYIEDTEDDLVPIWVKCVWALGKINTVESINYIQQFKNSPYERVQEAALTQLNRQSK